MEIDILFKIAAIGIIVSVLNQILARSGREEQATLTSLAGLIAVLMMLTPKIAELFDMVRELFEGASLVTQIVKNLPAMQETQV